MEIHISEGNDVLTLRFAGELDHHAARDTVTAIERALDAELPMQLTLDFGGVTFMDSSGIGLIMGRYKILQPLGSEIILQNAAPHISRILRLAGMERLAKMRTVQREVVQ